MHSTPGYFHVLLDQTSADLMRNSSTSVASSPNVLMTLIAANAVLEPYHLK